MASDTTPGCICPSHNVNAVPNPECRAHLPRFDITEISACTVCTHLVANGEYDDGEDSADKAWAGMERLWGDDTQYFIYGGSHDFDHNCGYPDGDCDADDLGFSWTSCESCGSSLGGDRHKLTVMRPL